MGRELQFHQEFLMTVISYIKDNSCNVPFILSKKWGGGGGGGGGGAFCPYTYADMIVTIGITHSLFCEEVTSGQ